MLLELYLINLNNVMNLNVFNLLECLNRLISFLIIA